MFESAFAEASSLARRWFALDWELSGLIAAILIYGLGRLVFLRQHGKSCLVDQPLYFLNDNNDCELMFRDLNDQGDLYEVFADGLIRVRNSESYEERLLHVSDIHFIQMSDHSDGIDAKIDDGYVSVYVGMRKLEFVKCYRRLVAERHVPPSLG